MISTQHISDRYSPEAIAVVLYLNGYTPCEYYIDFSGMIRSIKEDLPMSVGENIRVVRQLETAQSWDIEKLKQFLAIAKSISQSKIVKSTVYS